METEHRRFRWSGIGQFIKEHPSDAKDPSTELICPKPLRAAQVPCLEDCVGINGSKSKNILPLNKRNCIGILDPFVGKAEANLDTSEHCGFFCGSPPERSTNPIVHDKLFAKKNTSSFPSIEVKPTEGIQRTSPYGSFFEPAPKARTLVLAFRSCNARQHREVYALA